MRFPFYMISINTAYHQKSIFSNLRFTKTYCLLIFFLTLTLESLSSLWFMPNLLKQSNLFAHVLLHVYSPSASKPTGFTTLYYIRFARFSITPAYLTSSLLTWDIAVKLSEDKSVRGRYDNLEVVGCSVVKKLKKKCPEWKYLDPML